MSQMKDKGDNMAKRRYAGKFSVRKIAPAILIVCLMLLSPLAFVFSSNDNSSNLDADTQSHTIRYYYGSTTSGTYVDVDYYGIAATEYNPAYWSNSPWTGETENVSMVITSVPVSQQYLLRLDSGKLYFSYDDDPAQGGHERTGLNLSKPNKEEVIRIYLEEGATPVGVIPNSSNPPRPSSTQFNSWEDRFKYNDAGDRFKLTYWSDKGYVYVRFDTLMSQDNLLDLTTGDYVRFGLLFNAQYSTGLSVENVPVQKVFGGWTTSRNYDVNDYPTGIIYPGDVVPKNVTELHAVWIYPDIKVINAEFTSTTSYDTTNKRLTTQLSLDTDSLRTGIEPYITIDSLNISDSDKVGVYHYDYDQNKYVQGLSDSEHSMFSTIYHLDSSELMTVSSTTTIPSGTYRSASTDDLNVIGINASIHMGGDVVMDNLRFNQVTYDNSNRLGNSASFTINANYHRLIIGTNVDVDKKYLEKQKEDNPGYKGELLLAPYVIGGSGNHTSGSIEHKKIVSMAGENPASQNYELKDLEVDIATYVIIHSGTYAHISAGPTASWQVGGSSPLSTYAVVKDATVMGIVSGSAGSSIINGSMYDDRGAFDGGTFVYCCGTKTTGDRYEDLATGFDTDVHDYFYTDESSVVQGGCRAGKIYGSTHLFLSGTTSVFDAQAGGRVAESYCEHTYLEISGKAEVRHVACGTITDGSERTQNLQCVDGIDIYVVNSPVIATLLGAGYDTWSIQNYSTMSNGEINIEIAGGLIGYVYGGGMRGSVGTTNDSQKVDINIKMTDGEIRYDLFGGGKGALDKIHHKAKMTDGSQPDGSLGRWDSEDVNKSTNQKNSTGFSKVYGDITIVITGGEIDGNVYGGGESLPALKNYMDVYSLNSSPSTDVASVYGDVKITIDGSARIAGNVYGAGKGINIRDGAINKNAEGYYVDVETAPGYTGLKGNIQKIPYYSALMIHAGGDNGSFRFIPWISGPNPTVSSGIGIVEYYETQSDITKYVNYAKVNGTTDIQIKGGTVGGSVYGGGEMGITSFNGEGSATSVTMQNGQVNGSIYGGGLGVLDSTSVNGHSAVAISGGTVGGSVYGGSAYGITKSTSVSITGTAHLTRDVYGGGLGAPNHVSVLTDSTLIIQGNSKDAKVIIDGTVYGGSAYGINNGDVSTILNNCQINGNVYGGGLGSANNLSVKGKRTLKMLSGEVTMNLFGGSSDGNDGDSNYLTSDSVVMITAGTVGGSVFGGGLLGKTYGNTTIYIGYVQNEMGSYVPTPDSYSEANPVITIADSVYAGGEVDITGESTAAYTDYLVMGGGRVFVDGDHTDVSIKGSIMGSGNSCLTQGVTSAVLDHFNDPVEMAGLHRFTTVNLITSLLDIDGRDSIIGDETKKCSLSNIGTLTLTDSSTLLISNHVDNIGSFESNNKDDKPTTAASPFNKVIFKSGSTMFIRTIEKRDGLGASPTYTTTYGKVSGYTILSVASGNISYGGYVLGSENSTGGFMILKGGSYSVADRSKFSSGVICWFISGVESKTASLSLTYDDLNPGIAKTGQTTVDIAKLQSTSFMRYTGGMFIPSAEYTLGETDSVLELDLAYVDDTDRPSALVYTTGGEHPTYGLTFKSTDSEDKNLDTGSIIDSVFTPFSGDDRAGVFTINLKLAGVPDGSTRYLGYVILHLQEVNTISYQTPTGVLEDDIMICNKVELKIDLYMIGTNVEDNYQLNLWTVDDEGSVNMIFPDQLTKQSIHLLSMSSPEGAPAITIQPTLNEGNTTGWLITGAPIVRSTFNSDTSNPSTSTLLDVGTLSGSFMASLKISISDHVPDGSVYFIRLVMKDQDGNFITENGRIKEIHINLTVKERNDVKVTFYDYMHGVKRETGGIERIYNYGIQLTDADCPTVSENFLGWYSDEDFVNVFNFSTPITKNMELFARYSYAVTFDYQDGTYSVLYLASNLTGVTVTEPVQPSKRGYTFGGWYKQSKCIEQWDFSNDLINDDITLYAKWTGEEILVQFKTSESSDPLDYIEVIDGKVTTPVVNYGGSFEVIDMRESAIHQKDVTILDVAKEMVLEQQTGMTFIRWQVKVGDEWIPIYDDTRIDDAIINIDDAPIDPTYHIKVIELVALTSPVAIMVQMTTGVDDVSAVVTPPASFLVYPEEKSSHTEGGKKYHTYWFEYTLNDATRSGYYLRYWHNPDVTEDPLNPTAGLTRIVQIDAVEESDGHIYALRESLVINGQLKVVNTYTDVLPPLDDTSDQNVYRITYVAVWSLIDYRVTITDPVHGYIDAFKVDIGENNELVLTKGNSFTVHYGDRIKLVFTPYEDYQFYKWTYDGECLIEDENSNVTTMVVTGDSTIHANDTGERITRIYMSLNDTAGTPDTIYLKKDGEYKEFPKNPISDQERSSLYVGYLVSGEYTVCFIDEGKEYAFGNIEVGEGDNTYYFEVFSLSIEDVTGEPRGGIADYSKYAGRQVASDQPLFASITVSKGYTYRLSEGYYDDPTDKTQGYHEIRQLGIDESGTARDTEMVFQLFVDTLKAARFIEGEVNPVVFTVIFNIGDGESSSGMRNWNINGATNFHESIQRTYRYDHDFASPISGEGRMPIMTDFETVSGSLEGYTLFHWYIRYDDTNDEFDGTVYEDTVLNAEFLSRLTELDVNTFTLYAWIVFPSYDVTMHVETYLQNEEGTGYEYVQSSVSPVIAGSNGTYMGVFTIRHLEGFALDEDMIETEGMEPGSEIIKHEEDYKATIITILDEHSHSDVKVKLYYDRMTTVIELDSDGAVVDDDSWTLDVFSGLYKKTVRYGETVSLPDGTKLVKANSEFIAWIDSSGNTVANNEYIVTLSDVMRYSESHSNTVRLTASFEVTNAHTLTLLTSLGHFPDGSQRIMMKVTPDQFIPDLLADLDPEYVGGHYELTAQKYDPAIPDHIDQDLTLIAQWSVVPYELYLSIDPADEGARHIAVSGTYDSSEPFRITLANPYDEDLPHHSEITLTLRLDAGYDLNLEDTLAGLPPEVGQPEELEGGKGYRWTFFLDDDIEIQFHTKKATYDIYYIVNDSLFQTDHVEKYGIETLVNPVMTGYNWNGKWYSDKACTVEFSTHQFMVLESRTLYTKANAIEYTVRYHSNNAYGYTESETFVYGVEKTLKSFDNVPQFNPDGYLMIGWSDEPTDMTHKGELRHNLEETVINLSDNGGTIDLYAYYVKVECDTDEVVGDIVYDGTGYQMRIVKSSGDPSVHNLEMYYSTSVLSFMNYSTEGSPVSPSIKNAGTHYIFYYGWVWIVESDGQLSRDDRSFISGYVDIEILRKPVQFKSGSVTRSYIADERLYYQHIDSGIEGILEAERSGISYVFTYTNENGPIMPGSYSNAFRVVFDGITALSTNYSLTYVPGNLVIDATAANIDVDIHQTMTYGDTDHPLNATASETLTYEIYGESSFVSLNNDHTVNAIGAGTATIKISLPNGASKYVEITVDPKPIIVNTTISETEKVYDGTSSLTLDQVLNITSISGVIDVGEGVVEVTPTGRYTDGHGNATANAADSVPIEIGYVIGGSKGANYQIDTENSTVSFTGRITPKEVRITPASVTREYDGTPLTSSDYTAVGFINNNGIATITMTEESTITDVGHVFNNVSRYTLLENTIATNYTIITEEDTGVLEITPKTVQIPASGTALHYSGMHIAAPIESSHWYVADTTDERTTVSAEAIGEYQVVLKLVGNHDEVYNVIWSDFSHGIQVIDWSIISTQLNHNRFELTAHEFPYEGIPYDNILTYVPSYSGIDYVEYDPSTGIGDYRIIYPDDNIDAGDKTVRVVGMNGYAGSSLEYEYIIQKRQITINAPMNQMYLYDGQPHTPVYSYSGVLDSDLVSGGVSFVLTNGDKVDYKNGGYTSILTLTGEKAGNYLVPETSINWSIERRIAYIAAESNWGTESSDPVTDNKYRVVGILEDDLSIFHISVEGSQNGVGSTSNVVVCDVLDEDRANNYEIHLINGTLIMTCSANDISYISTSVETER